MVAAKGSEDPDITKMANMVVVTSAPLRECALVAARVLCCRRHRRRRETMRLCAGLRDSKAGFRKKRWTQALEEYISQ